MIDINELRRLAQAATHPTTKGRWMRLFGDRTVYDRLEDGCRGIPVASTPVHPPHQFEAACLDFIAAANPAATSELLDRLEAAEKSDAESLAMYRKARDERDALRAKIEAAEKERDNANAAAAGVALKAQKQEEDRAIDTQRMAILVAELNGAERERDALRAALQHEADCVEAAKAEIEALRAKIECLRARIEEMEKQESVATVIKEGDSRYWMSERLWTFPDGKYPLYALPGAQPALSVPDGWRLVPIVSTHEMKEAGACAGAVYYAIAKDVWSAMLAAAPEAKL